MKIVKIFNQVIIIHSNGNLNQLAILSVFIVLNIVIIFCLIYRYFYIKHIFGWRYKDTTWYQKVFLQPDNDEMNIFTFSLVYINAIALFIYLILIVYGLLL